MVFLERRADLCGKPSRELEMDASAPVLQAVVDALPAHIALLNSEGVIVLVNAAWRRFAAANDLADARSCLGANYVSLCEQARGEGAEEARRVAVGIKSVLRGEAEQFDIEYPCHSPTEQRWFLLIVTRPEGASAPYAVVTHVNVTARVRAEHAQARADAEIVALTKREELHNKLFFEQTPLSMVMFDRGLRVLQASDRWKQNYLLTGETRGQRLPDIVPNIPVRWIEILQKALSGQTLHSDEDFIQRPNGVSGYISWTVRPWYQADGEIGGVLSFSEDVSARKALEEARRASDARVLSLLRDNERQLGFFIDQAPVSIAMFDADMRYLACSQSWKRDYRISGEVIGRSHYDVFPELTDSRKAVHRRALAGETIAADEDAFVRTDGSVQWLKWDIRPWIHPKDGIGGVVIYSEDVSRRHAAVSALRKSEQRLSAVVDNAFDAIIVIDRKGAIVSVNPATRALFGYSEAEIVGRNVTMLMPVRFRDEHDGHLVEFPRNGVSKIIGNERKLSGLRKDGSEFPMLLAIADTQANEQDIFVGFIRDLTQIESEKRHAARLQSELRHVNRLSEIDMLASGLAHEINQPLAAITNYVEVARLALGTGAARGDLSALSALDKIESQSERAVNIIRGLREYVDKRHISRRPENLSALISGAMSLAVSGEEHRETKLLLDEAAGGLFVNVDRVQIQQVIINFLRNAFEAMETSRSREVTIATKHIDSSHVRVAVTDAGPGIDPSYSQKLFVPFATTKTQGMGLGLSICKAIIEGHGGTIGAESNPEGGATFFFTLPLVTSENATEALK